MHHNSITIALTSERKKPYREYGFKKVTEKCKKSEVVLPFDSNYQILVKNGNSTRIKLEIDIDGSIISGSGLIVPANSQSYIERFVDVASKLYFTKKSNEKVADPTSAENGFLTVKVVKEKIVLPTYMINTNMWVGHWPYNYEFGYGKGQYVHDPIHWQPSSWATGSGSDARSTTNGNNLISCGDGILRSCSMNLSKSANYAAGHSVPTSFVPANAPELGATIEGDHSAQSFIDTTWSGDEVDSDFIFQFKMLGKDNTVSAQDEKDAKEYERLHAKFG